VFAVAAQPYLLRLAADAALEELAPPRDEVLALLAPLDDDAVRGLTYAPGKWTLKQVVGHLADDERIFAYRALCVARGDATPLPGFDEKVYAAHSGAEARPLASLLAEYRAVRDASLALFEGLAPEAWLRRGVVNGYAASVRGLAFHIAGHELRHVDALRHRYLTAR
jgi:hypothetical protein